MGAASSVDAANVEEEVDSDVALLSSTFTSAVVNSSFLSIEEIALRLTRTPTRETRLGARPCRYAALMMRGLYPDHMTKPCQDAYVIHEADLGSSDMHWFQVFDGHGPDGHKCAWYCRDHMKQVANTVWEADTSVACDKLLVKTNETLNSNLHATVEVPSRDSGTTAVSILAVGSTLYCSNVGDSRCIIGVRGANGKVVPKALSHDQTLYRADERARIRAAGGRVLSIGQIEGRVPVTEDFECALGDEIDAEGDPPRIWLPDRFEPGCAFSRSLGDFTAETVGCVATPEIAKHEISDDDVVAVIASDGIWEFITNQQVVDICVNEPDPYVACHKIVAKSYKEWYDHEERIDDISIIILYFRGADATAVVDTTALTEAADTQPVQRGATRTRRGSTNLKTAPTDNAKPAAKAKKPRGRRGSFNFPGLSSNKKDGDAGSAAA